MRVYNLTDVPTPVLVSRELVHAPVQVGGVYIQPGDHADVPNPAGARDLLTIGAITIDRLPGWYLEEKAKIPRERSGPPSSPPPPPDEPPPPPDAPAPPPETKEEPEEETVEETVTDPVEEKPSKKSKKKRGRK